MIVNLGDLMVDIFDDRRHPGGKAALYAAAQSLAGVPASVIGAVGDDPHGQLVVETLRSLGVDTRGVLQVGSETGWDRVDGDSWEIHRGANLAVDREFAERPELAPVWESADLVVVNQGVIASAGEFAIEQAAGRGTFVVLAAAPEAVEPVRRIDPAFYSKADIIVANQVEAEHLFAERGIAMPSSPEAVAEALWSLSGPRLAFMYCRGVKGAVAAFATREGNVEVRSVAPAPTYLDNTENYIGAGDALVGYLTAALGHAEASGVGAAALVREHISEVFARGVEIAAETTNWRGPLTCAQENPLAFRAAFA